jgi:hypothetical protein
MEHSSKLPDVWYTTYLTIHRLQTVTKHPQRYLGSAVVQFMLVAVHFCGYRLRMCQQTNYHSKAAVGLIVCCFLGRV